MDIKTRNRTELKSYFVKNAIPTESNFAELIDGMLNPQDDRVAKQPGDPLSIEAAGDPTSDKKVLNLYHNFNDPSPAWTLSLNPWGNPADSTTARDGFSVSDGQGNSRLFIDRSTGHVGIGTTTAASVLTIKGNGATREVGITQNQAGGGATMELTTSDGAGAQATRLLFRGNNDNANIEFYRGKQGGETVSMFIQGSDGNVGIGTNSPGATLHVINTPQDANGNTLILGPTNAANLRLGYHANYSWVQSHGLKPLAINPVGNNVGIGTTNPSDKLTVYDGDISITGGRYRRLKIVSDQYWAGIELVARNAGESGRPHIDFTIGNLDSPNYGIRISAPRNNALTIEGGSLGIGTTDPQATLDVKGAIFAGESDIYFTDTNHNHTTIGNASGYAAIENAKNYDALMILGRAGTNVGRKVRLWDYLEVVGVFVNHSDQRAKQDIADLAYGLEEIKRLRPVSFNWRSIPNPHKSLGLIAQEVEPVIGEVVFADEDNGASSNLSIAYTALVPVLVNAIKELDAKLERIKADNVQR